MPKKRPLELRVAEAQDKLDRLELEKRILELRAKMPRRVRRKTPSRRF